MECYPLDTVLKDYSVRDLPLNRRQQLGSYLNTEQILESESGLARDFRGIAQQLSLSYADIVKLEKMIDPFGTMLSYQAANSLQLFTLMRMIEHIGRFDVLDDVVPQLVSDIKLDLINNKRKDEVILYNKNPAIISSDSGPSTIWYDAYICYADSDLTFVRSLTEYLESSSIGLRLFVRDRDLLGGNWVYETFARLIESQCRRVLIILSPEFLQCPDCAFQSQFAASLGIEKRARILIPIIYKSCELPAMIRLLSKIDMTSCSATADSPASGALFMSNDWALNRLVKSLQNETALPQLPPSSSSSSSSTNAVALVGRQKLGTISQKPQQYQEYSSHNLPSTTTTDCRIEEAPSIDSKQLSTCSSILSNNSTATYYQSPLNDDDDDERKLIECTTNVHHRTNIPDIDKRRTNDHYNSAKDKQIKDNNRHSSRYPSVKTETQESSIEKNSLKPANKTLLSTLRRKIKNIL